jgi:serine/threonine protein kinase
MSNTARGQEGDPAGKLSSAPPGSRIFGKFRLLANLGAGGMGEVFLALSRSSLGGVNKLVVIKRLRHFAEDEARSEARQMFLNEARLATLLNHPNIVQTNDVGLEDGHMFLTMEYLEGQPLNAIARAAKVKGTKLDDAILLKIISDSLAGLHYAHELRDYEGTPLSIVHRDLSPHNLFVTYEGVAKVVDFGIAKSAGTAKTEQGIIKGKFAYMAPEQAQDDKVDRRADIFVMGIVLWELLTGERLVFRRNDIQTINRLLNDNFAPPSAERGDISPELDAIVMKALAKDPERRYQTAQEMREALEEHLLARSHPVRQEEVGPLISELFSEERTLMRQRIRQCIASAPDDAGMDSLPALSSRGLEVTPEGSRPLLEPRMSASPGALSGTLAATITRGGDGGLTAPASSKKLGVVLAVTAVAAAVISVLIYAGVTHRAASPVAATAPLAEPAKTASATPAPDTAPPIPVEIARPAAAAAAPPAASAAAAVTSTPAEAATQKTSAPRHGSHSNPAPAPHPAGVTPPAPPAALAPAPAPTQTGRVFNTSL